MSAIPTGRLAGRVAVVTGAASGLGLASAVRFGEEGARVVLADLDAEATERAADAVRARGADALAVVADVTSAASQQAMAAAAIERFGRIDVLYANAGINTGEGRAHEVPLEDWDRVVAVNLTGVFLSARVVLPSMIAQGRGSILLQASIGGLAGLPNMPGYAATKGGVIALARQLAVEYAGDGIRVNAICPGTVATALVLDTYARRREAGVDMHASLDARRSTMPLGRLGEPEDIANLALFLASDEAGWITGASYTADGGESAALHPRHRPPTA